MEALKQHRLYQRKFKQLNYNNKQVDVSKMAGKGTEKEK